jgi:drug/metabolite transporter (DMT)-like permease
MKAPAQAKGQGVPVRVGVMIAVGLLAISCSPILIRYASEGPGLAIATWRTLVAAALLAPVAFARAGAEISAFGRRDWMLIGAAGLFLATHFIFFIESLFHTTVASSGVLVSTTPIFLAILGWVVLRERVTARTVVAIAVAFAGAVVIGVSDHTGGSAFPRAWMGNGMALLAALFAAAYLIIGRAVRQGTNWLVYVAPLYAIVAVVILAVALVRGVPLLGYSPQFYGLCALMAVGPSLLGHGSFNYAVKYVSATLIGLLTLLEPIAASLAALWLFGEVPAALGIAGMALALGGVVIALVPVRRRKKASV